MKPTMQNGGRSQACRRQGGFTLLEIIVTIVVAAIMGVFFVQFVATHVLRSIDPVVQVQNVSNATQIMETMNKDYKWLASTQTNFLATFKDYVDKGNMGQGRPAGYPDYGSYTVPCNKYVRFNASGVEEEDPDQFTGQVLKVTIRSGNQTVTALFTR